MKNLKVLILTDHQKHSAENSLYALAKMMALHSLCSQVDVATRYEHLNNDFFENKEDAPLFAVPVSANFEFSTDGNIFKEGVKSVKGSDYDAIWLRMPPPLSASFLHYLEEQFPETVIVNHPKGILEAGSKAFLLNFAELCPPLKICRSIEDIVSFRTQFPIVLKPFRDYGGKGIVRIDGEQVWIGKESFSFDEFIKSLEGKTIEYLGVKFLQNVDQGDKRIIVVDGQIMGASLRMPAKDSWLCNVAMGGHAKYADVDASEIKMIEQINPILAGLGVVMYGVDTLMGDNGQRVLSELNTTSIGGLPQMAAHKKEPLVEKAIDLIVNRILKTKKE